MPRIKLEILSNKVIHSTSSNFSGGKSFLEKNWYFGIPVSEMISLHCVNLSPKFQFVQFVHFYFASELAKCSLARST